MESVPARKPELNIVVMGRKNAGKKALIRRIVSNQPPVNSSRIAVDAQRWVEHSGVRFNFIAEQAEGPLALSDSDDEAQKTFNVPSADLYILAWDCTQDTGLRDVLEFYLPALVATGRPIVFARCKADASTLVAELPEYLPNPIIGRPAIRTGNMIANSSPLTWSNQKQSIEEVMRETPAVKFFIFDTSSQTGEGIENLRKQLPKLLTEEIKQAQQMLEQPPAVSQASPVVELNPGREVEKEATQNLVKVVLVGDAEVGKSQALLVMTNKPFSGKYDKTVGLEFGAKVVVCDGIPIKLQLWDIAGDETTRELTQSYYRNTPLFCVMWGDPAGKSLAVVKSEVEFIENHYPKATIVFVRCKSDLDAKLTMDVENQLKSIEATTKGRPIFHTSAKTRQGIDDLLRAIAIAAAALPDVKARAEVKAESPVLQRGAQYGLSVAKSVVSKSNPFAACLRNPKIMLLPKETHTHIVNPKDNFLPDTRIREAQLIKVPDYDKKDRQFRFERIREMVVNLTQEDLKPETIWLLLNLLSIGQREVSFGSKSIVSGYIEAVLEKLFICAPGEIEAFVLRKINAADFCESEFPYLNMKELIKKPSSSSMCAVLHLLQILDSQERDLITVFNRDLIEPTKQALYEIALAVFEKPEMTKEDISALLQGKNMFEKIKAEVVAILNQYLQDKPVLNASIAPQ